MDKLELIFSHEKETKNTVRYQEELDQQVILFVDGKPVYANFLEELPFGFRVHFFFSFN